MPTQSPTRQSSKAHHSTEALLARYADGSIIALSLTQPGRVYRVQLAPLACECLGFAHRGSCYHTAAAVERFGGLRCLWCESTEAVTTYENHADYDPLRDGTVPTIHLCAACLPPPAPVYVALEAVR